MCQKKIAILERAIIRERAARKQAEKILEGRSTELYELTVKLSKANSDLLSSVEEKNSQLKGIFENIIDAYVVMDTDFFVVKMNDAAVQMLGYDSRLEKINLTNLVHPEDVQKTKGGLNTLFTKGDLTNFHLKIITKNKTDKIVQINASIVYDKNNIPIAAQGIIRDITKEVEAKYQLIASENRLSSLILNLDTGLLLEDENKKIILTNTKFCDLFSIPLTPKELVGLDCSKSAEESKDIFVDSEMFVTRIQELVFAKKMVLGDELLMKNGKILERDYIPVFENEQYKGHMWSYRDVTLQRRYSLNIEVQRRKYSNIIANMNLGLLEVDKEDKILMANQSFLDMSGYVKDELIGLVAKDVFLANDAKKKILKESEDRLVGNSNSYELVIRKKNKENRNWLVSGAPQYNINGEFTGSIGIHLDITDFRNLEKQQEVLLEKLEKSNTELEEYAHIVSHDLKSPLRSLSALVTWLKEDNEGKFDKISLGNFDLIERTLETMEKLISDILEYSSITSDSEKNDNVDLNEVVENLHHVLFIPKHIELRIKNKLPVLKGDATRFQQLFLNIVSNAVRYIDKEKGLVEVAVNEFSSYYEFSIRDNGIGIEKKDFNRIFKIFQALTDHKESSGIGLSIVKKIINLYKGEIWLESEVSIGTTFYFTILKQKL
jgi:PAS domain S-box-containing protein